MRHVLPLSFPAQQPPQQVRHGNRTSGLEVVCSLSSIPEADGITSLHQAGIKSYWFSIFLKKKLFSGLEVFPEDYFFLK